MNFADITLGQLLSNTNDIIKRNALSILKQLQKERDAKRHKCICCMLPKATKAYRLCTDCERDIERQEKDDMLSSLSKH